MNYAPDLAATAPLWLPMVGCLAVLVAETVYPGRTGKLPGFLCGATIALAFARLITTLPSGREPFGMLADDSLARSLSGLLLLITFAVVVMAEPLLERLKLARGEFYALLLASLSGMLLLVAARDLLALFLAIELLSIPLYVLAAFRRLSAPSVESGFKYFLLGAFASGFLVYGIALLFAACGDTRYSALANYAADPARLGTLWKIGTTMLLVGLGFKVAAAPFHAWTPDVYQGAPTPVTAFMAAGVKCAAFGGLLRFADEVLPDGAGLRLTLTILACASMLVGNLGALLQTNLKRLLAWSSIAHAGYLLVGVLAVVVAKSGDSHSAGGIGPSARDAVVFYLASYALTTLAAFAWIEQVGRESAELQDLRSLRGLARRRPWLAAALALCFLSLAGVPLTAGFLGKLYVLRAAFALRNELLVPMVVLALTSVIALGYYLRVLSTFYMERPADEDAPPRALFASTGIALLTTVACGAVLLFGVWPDPLLRWLAG
ncbi:MAG: NADH-quinone oxidoreductase subunit N [Planctomycetes bacterium]|nr:NADH-quinone oxidoreductase subunit N [Planctomycetota bacterium]